MHNIRNRKKVLPGVLSGGGNIKDFYFLNSYQKILSMKSTHSFINKGWGEWIRGKQFIITRSISSWVYFLLLKTKLIQVHNRENNLKICKETQKTMNRQRNLEKEEQSWKNHMPWLQTILQRYSHQNIMVLAPKKNT